MLSGGAGWSLWEPFCVWMTPTAALRRAPVVQLNPDLADKAGRARACTHSQACGQATRVDSHTRANQKHKPAHKRTPGNGPSEAPAPPTRVVPVVGDWGHTAAKR